MIGPRLAGRGAALEAVVDVVASAMGGAHPAVLVAGEAGAGKTQFLADVVDAVRRKGGAAVAVRATRSEHAPPCAAMIDAVVDAAALAGGANIEELRDVRVAAILIFDALRRRGPVVLLVDDMPAMDDASAEVLLRLCERPAANPLVLVASQSIPSTPLTPAVEELLSSLERGGDVLRITLEPLDAEELAAVVVRILDSDPTAELVEGLRRATGGNAFLATQVVLGWQEAGAVAVDRTGARLADASVPLPRERRDRIVGKVLGHDPETRCVAAAAALLGASRIDMLADVSRRPLPAVAAVLDGLVKRGVLVEHEGSLAFTRPVVCDAVRETIGPGERWRLRQAAVEWLSVRPPSPPVAFELAELVTRVGEVGDERAINHLVRAAHLARDLNPRSAVRWYGAALDLMPLDHLDRPLVLSRLSRELFVAGQLSGSLEVGRAALAQLPPGDEQRRSEYLVTEAVIASTMETLSDDGIDFLREQREKRPDDLRLLAATAHVLARAGRVAEAEETLAPAAAVYARAEVDDSVIARVHLARANSLLGHFEEMHLEIERVLASIETASFQAQLVGLCYASFMLAEHGDPRAGELIALATALQERSHWDLWQTELELARILDDYRAGRWDSALSRIATVTPRFEAAGSSSRLAITRSVAVEILACRGEWSTALRIDCHGIPSRTFEDLRLWATSNVDLLVGDTETAVEALTRGVQGATTPPGRGLLLSRLGQAYLDQGRTDDAAVAVAELLHVGPADRVGLYVLEGRRVYGAATGDQELLRVVLAEAERRGTPLLRAGVLLDLGVLGIDVEANLREAYRVFHEMGADPWRRRAATQLRAAGLKVPRHRLPASGLLTDAELQVARLVQQGRRNREIAQALCMSVKTVEAYLTRIYRKTNSSSRIELARTLDQLIA